MPLKILHIAPQNFAGMPFDFMKMHNSEGDSSRLITLYKNTLNFDEDLTLGLELPKGKAARKWRKSKIDTVHPTELKYCEPKNVFEKVFFKMRDQINKGKISRAIKDHELNSFDIYHFDGGMDLFRDLRFAEQLKKSKKKIVCCYFGSDLRVRGVFKRLDEMSDLNLTVEFDHLQIHPKINYIHFPFDSSAYTIAKKNNKKLKIIHSPTNRLFKGTDKILKVIDEVDKIRNIEFILLENMERSRVLEIKSQCDLAIDQVGGVSGGTGYGKNSAENLAMGIPTFTEFTEDYLEFIKENPFIHSTVDTLKDNILKFIDNEVLRNEYSLKGRVWLEKYHSFESVNNVLRKYYEEAGIIDT